MLFIGQVRGYEFATYDIFNGRIRVAISPITYNYVNGKPVEAPLNELPLARPLINNEHEFKTLSIGDYVYLYTEDENLQDLYYIGKENKTIDYNNIFNGLGKINEALEGKGIVHDTVNSYVVANQSIKIERYGDELVFINGTEGYTIMSSINTGMTVYKSGSEFRVAYPKLYKEKGKDEPEYLITKIVLKDGDIKIYSQKGNISLYADNVSISAEKQVNLNGAEGYVVMCPYPGATFNLSGMTLASSSTVKVGGAKKE